MWTWQGLFCKLSQGGLTSTLESELASHIVISALQSSWWSLSFLRARIWPDLSVFLLLPVMHLVDFLLPHSSSMAVTFFRSQLHSAPAALKPPVMIRRLKQLWHTGWEYKFSIPITGMSFFVQAHSRTCSNCLLGIGTFTPGDRSTWHPGDAGSYPAASHLQRRPRNGFFTLICVGPQHETLGWGLCPSLASDFLANSSPRCQNMSDCLSSIWNTLCSVKSAFLKASNPTFLQKVYEAKPGFGVQNSTFTGLSANIWWTVTLLLSHYSNS